MACGIAGSARLEQQGARAALLQAGIKVGVRQHEQALPARRHPGNVCARDGRYLDLSLLVIAEFVMAPINLWTGRTMPLFTRFTGYAPASRCSDPGPSPSPSCSYSDDTERSLAAAALAPAR
jgi:hypothetical protein